MTVSHFIYAALCVGIANIFIEWLLIGFVFHKYQALTPQTWKPESPKSYAYSSFISLLFGALFTLFYYKIATHYVARGNVLEACKFGLFCFGVFAFLPEITTAIYVNISRGFTMGRLLSSLFTYVAAAAIVCLFY
ncbi:MAG: hypothetical protein JST32_05640 [Bacteroidetes bacterium]|nr:hypothetical protein [Bacteroidota bacterium]